jgi:hypothetical protein
MNDATKRKSNSLEGGNSWVTVSKFSGDVNWFCILVATGTAKTE